MNESSLEDVKVIIQELEKINEDNDNIKSQLEAINQANEDLKKYINESKLREKNAYIISNILIPVTAAGIFSTGMSLYCCDQKEIGKVVMWSAAIELISVEAVYQCGHWVFKLW